MNCRSSFQGGLIITAVMLPGFAGVVTTALYLTLTHDPPDGVGGTLTGAPVFLLGTGLAFLTWVIASFACRRLSAPERGNTAVYGQLLELLASLETNISGDPINRAVGSPARARITQNICAVKKELGIDGQAQVPVGVVWALGTGYAAVWRRLHDIDADQYYVCSREALIERGLYDDFRLRHSTIPEREELLRSLAMALCALRPKAVKYLPVGAGRSEGLDGASEPDALAMLRQIRVVVNDFRDDRRDGLVRARNNLSKAVILTGFTAYTLLGLALIKGVSHEAVVAMSAFYLVGAIVGLFRQLNVASAISTVKEEDYGLAAARLVNTPLFSGVAAVMGVVLIGILGTVIPTTGSAPKPGLATLGQIFSLSHNLYGLVAAAAFGLAPTTLITRLQAQAEQFKKDLSSSDASGGSVPSSG